jgi:hypothetical protein
MRRPWPTRGFCAIGKKKTLLSNTLNPFPYLDMNKIITLISGFRRDVDEICDLVGKYTALCGK